MMGQDGCSYVYNSSDVRAIVDAKVSIRRVVVIVVVVVVTTSFSNGYIA